MTYRRSRRDFLKTSALAGLGVVLVAEFVSPILLWLKGRALYAALLFWAGFHLSTYVMLKIHFLPLVVCLAAFLPLERLGTISPRAVWSRGGRPRLARRAAG